MSAELIDWVGKLGTPRVLVVGDVMVDRYVWGDAERISQEAPVILLRADRREERLGGASSVAVMLHALGAKVRLAGVLGTDSDARTATDLLAKIDVDGEDLARDPGRPTTMKERYIGRAQARHPQQMLRVDYETREPVSGEVEDDLIHRITAAIPDCEIVLVSDYDKGVCTPRVMEATIQAARRQGIRVVADPIRGGDYAKYHGCSAITPNRLEAGLAVQRVIDTLGDAERAAKELRDRLDLEAAIITLDKDGMYLDHTDGTRKLYPTRPRQVYDITGAGDMVMSVLGLALAAGADYPTAIRLANIAGGLEVEKIGVATVSREEIIDDLTAHGMTGGKVHTLADLLPYVASHRRMGRRIVFTNGCFDVLHVGHVQYLQEARSQGDVLIVGMNTDSSVRALKGHGRPVNPEEARSAVLAGLQAVDYVVPFGSATPIELIHAIRPDVLVKGADYRKDAVVGGAFVESLGGRVHLAEFRPGFSTSELLRKLPAA